MSSTRRVPIRVAWLRAYKIPKSHQVGLAVTQYGTVSGVTLENPPEHHRHTLHTTVTASYARRWQKPMWVLTTFLQNLHVSLRHAGVQGALPAALCCWELLPWFPSPSSYLLKSCLLFLNSYPFLFYVFLTCSAEMSLRQVHSDSWEGFAFHRC